MHLPHPDELLRKLTLSLAQLLDERQINNPAMIGIYTGGAWIAQELHRHLGLTEPLGTLDISFYRDDFTTAGLHPQVRPSQLSFNVEGRHIILVDDVLHTGRTIRAALNEIFDFGRPASVILATLAARDGRELPIQPDVTGVHLQMLPGQYIKLTGPTPLAFTLIDRHPNRPVTPLSDA